MSGCNCNVNRKSVFDHMEEHAGFLNLDKPLEFDIPKAVQKFKTEILPEYQKTTIIEDVQLVPEEKQASISGWFIFGSALLVGGVIFKAW